MTAEQISALGRTLFAGLATGLGGLLALGPKPTPRAMAAAMGFAAGVMTAVSLTDLLPTALGWYRRAFSPEGAALALVSLLCMGMALAALLERCLPEQTGRGLDERRAGALRSALITGAALVLHNLPEGVLTLFAGAADSALGLRMVLAVALHNLPEGLAVALPLYYATGSRRRAVGAAFASGLAEPAGAVLAYALVGGRLRPGFLNGLLVLVAGVLLYTLIGSGKTGDDRPDPPKNPTEDVDPNQPATPTVKLSLDQTALELTVGGTGKLTATGAEGITWTSGNAGVAAVDEDGTVTAVAAGTATISASAEGADPVTCTVTVKEAPKKDLVLRSIYNSKGVAQTEFSMSVGDPAVPMTVDGTDSTVKWSTEHSNIATINSDGEVTAVSSGRTTIIAEVDGQTLKCEVLVN